MLTFPHMIEIAFRTLD